MSIVLCIEFQIKQSRSEICKLRYEKIDNNKNMPSTVLGCLPFLGHSTTSPCLSVDKCTTPEIVRDKEKANILLWKFRTMIFIWTDWRAKYSRSNVPSRSRGFQNGTWRSVGKMMSEQILSCKTHSNNSDRLTVTKHCAFFDYDLMSHFWIIGAITLPEATPWYIVGQISGMKEYQLQSGIWKTTWMTLGWFWKSHIDVRGNTFENSFPFWHCN